MNFPIGQVSDISGVYGATGASAPMPPSQKMSALFDSIDTTRSGSITKPQLDAAFTTVSTPRPFKQMGSDAVFKQLDPQGTGTVSKPQFVQTMTSLMGQLRNSVKIAPGPQVVNGGPVPQPNAGSGLTSVFTIVTGDPVSPSTNIPGIAAGPVVLRGGPIPPQETLGAGIQTITGTGGLFDFTA